LKGRFLALYGSVSHAKKPDTVDRIMMINEALAWPICFKAGEFSDRVAEWWKPSKYS
jgi:hypothetical protein